MADRKYKTDKTEREKRFHEQITDGGLTPEGLILDVMRDEKAKYTERQYQAAKDLLPYRLPRLNSIDAVSANVNVTQDEWVKLMAEGTEEDGDG